jgi:hypothetical protein
MKLPMLFAAMLMMLLSGCASEVDKCVDAAMKAHAAQPEPKDSAAQEEARVRMICLRLASKKE